MAKAKVKVKKIESYEQYQSMCSCFMFCEISTNTIEYVKLRLCASSFGKQVFEGDSKHIH